MDIGQNKVSCKAVAKEGSWNMCNRNPTDVDTYRRFGHVDAHEEEELGDEEVNAQILVDGVAVTLQAAEEAESEDANGEADKRNGDAHSRDDCQQEFMDAPLALENTH